MQTPSLSHIDKAMWEKAVPIIFYIFLTTSGLLWINLGIAWYAKVIPFYDSLVYQMHTENILQVYKLHGWNGLLENSFFIYGVNGYLYKIWIAILAPLLPLSRTVLYAYFVPLYVASLVILFKYLYRKTNSLLLALVGPLLYLSTGPFRRLVQGVLDQRLDLATASFALLLWVALLDFIENPQSIKKTVYLGIVTGLAILHRPIFIVQASLAGLMLVCYGLWAAYKNQNIKLILKRSGVAISITVVLLLPWLIFNMTDFYNYYFVNGYDVGRFSVLESLNFYSNRLQFYVGKPVLIIAIMFLVYTLLLRALSWKYLSIILGLIYLPLVPLVVSGSANPPVAQISIAAIGLIPLIFFEKRSYNPAILSVFTLLAAVVAVWNIVILTQAVDSADSLERRLAEEVILELKEKYFIDESPVYLSGFTLAGGGVSAISSIARMDLGIPIYTGLGPSHAIGFGLPPRATAFSEDELNQAVICELEMVYRRGGILMLIEPTQVEALQPKLTWPFSHQMATRIDKFALESGRLVDSGIMVTFEEMPVHFYLIKSDESTSVNNCRK